ncbi:MAG: sigma-70 family RNA polymerase sigma factor [Planctomycetota bacterium]
MPAHDSNRQPSAADEAVARAADGDTRALEGLLRALGPGVCASLVSGSRWSREFDAEDLLQVTSIEAILRIRALRVRTEAGFRAWLTRIAENNLRDAIRGLTARIRTPDGRRITHGANGASARTLLNALQSGAPTASAIYGGHEAVDQLKAAIARLPTSYRQVVEQLDLEERDLDEVARSFGRSKGALHMLRARAHERLRELLVRSA